MSKISELTDGGSLLPTDTLIAVRSGANVKVVNDTINVTTLNPDQINMGDNEQIRLGNSQDLLIYHDGSNNYVDAAGLGHLYLQSQGVDKDVKILSDDGSDGLVEYFRADGSLGQAQLYYYGDKKLNTISTGIDVTGNATFDDNGKAIFGAGSDLQIYHDGSASYIDELGTGDLYIRSNGNNLRLQSYGGENFLRAVNNGTVELFYDNVKKLETTSTGIDVTGSVTADGLTVDGDTTINRAILSSTTSDPALEISARSDTSNLDFKFTDTDGSVIVDQVHHKSEYYATDGAQVSAKVRTEYADVSGGMNYVISTSGAGVAVRDRIKVGSNGDISFYEDTGTTAKFFWDASAESLGIGTTTPARLLELETTTANESYLRISGSSGNVADTNFAGIEFYNLDSSAAGPNVASFIEARAETSTGAGGELVFATLPSTASEGARAIERLRIDASGNVGIGESSPTFDVQIRRAAEVNLGLSYTGQTTSELAAEASAVTALKSSGNLRFVTNTSTEAMRIDNSGNVGIGTTSPNTTLHVSSTTTTKSVVETTGASSDALIEFTKGQGSGNTWSMGIDHSNSSAFSLAYLSNGSPSLTTHGLLTVDTSGNVGIGSSSPASGLELEGVGNATNVTLDNTTASTGRSYSIRSGNTGNLDFYDNDATTARVTINSSGSVGIGTSSPGGKLSIRATSFAGSDSHFGFGANNDIYLTYGSTGNTIVRTVDGSGANSEKIRIDSSGNFLVGTSSGLSGRIVSKGLADGSIFTLVSDQSDFGTGTVGHISFRNANGAVGSIQTTGSATAYNTSSDQRLKDNIVDAPSASDDIDAIQVRSFDWKADGSHQKYGMIAQELQTVAPEAVSQSEDPEEMMGVDYSKLVPMMLKEIQQLRARVAQLEGAN